MCRQFFFCQDVSYLLFFLPACKIAGMSFAELCLVQPIYISVALQTLTALLCKVLYISSARARCSSEELHNLSDAARKRIRCFCTCREAPRGWRYMRWRNSVHVRSYDTPGHGKQIFSPLKKPNQNQTNKQKKPPNPALSLKKVWVQHLLNLYLCLPILWKGSPGSTFLPDLWCCVTAWMVIYFKRQSGVVVCTGGGMCRRGQCFLRFWVWLMKASWLVVGLVRRGVAAGGWMDGFIEVCLSSEYQTGILEHCKLYYHWWGVIYLLFNQN